MVLDHDLRHAGVSDVLNDLRQALDLGRIDAGGRLVEQQQARLQRERTGDLQQTLLAVGEVLREFVRALGDAHELEQRHGLAAKRHLLVDRRPGLQQMLPDSRMQVQMKSDHDVVEH